MTIIWLLTLLAYGAMAGFEKVTPALLLPFVPFAMSDFSKMRRDSILEKHTRAIALLIDTVVRPQDESLESAIDAGLMGSMIANSPEKQKGGLMKGMVGISLNDAQRAELRERADKMGMTTEEMMIEIIAQRLKMRGISIDSARAVHRPDED